jgi:hypothetical protein
MEHLKLGLATILGIIAPGSLVCFAISLGIIGTLEYHHLVGYRRLLAGLFESQILLTVLLLLLSFLLGSSIRLFANDVVEVLSGCYLRWIRRKKTRITGERFPYPVVAEWIRDKIDPKIEQYLSSKNSKFAEQGNKDFYNYCKMYVQAHSPARAALCEQIEAYVRFLAGSFISSLLTFAVSSTFSLLFWFSGRLAMAYSFFGLAISMMLVMVAILERFRHQHTREVIHTWVAFYDVSMERESQNAQR